MPSPTAYELYRSGVDLLEQGDNHAAALPLARARDLEPTTAMVREALGRALFSSQRYREAAEEFAVLVELEPLNDYGQFCLGRALQLQGLHAQARPPLTLAALLQPARRDYAMYRDRTIAALAGGASVAGAGEEPAGGTGEEPVAEGEPVSVDPPTSRRSGAGPWGAPTAAPPADDASGSRAPVDQERTGSVGDGGAGDGAEGAPDGGGASAPGAAPSGRGPSADDIVPADDGD